MRSSYAHRAHSEIRRARVARVVTFLTLILPGAALYMLVAGIAERQDAMRDLVLGVLFVAPFAAGHFVSQR